MYILWILSICIGSSALDGSVSGIAESRPGQAHGRPEYITTGPVSQAIFMERYGTALR